MTVTVVCCLFRACNFNHSYLLSCKGVAIVMEVVSLCKDSIFESAPQIVTYWRSTLYIVDRISNAGLLSMQGLSKLTILITM